MTDRSGSTWQITGRHVAFGMVAFFTVIVVVDLIMIRLALTTFSGLETSDSYRKGLAYNERIAVERDMANTGWTSNTTYDAAKAELRFKLSGSSGAQAAGSVVTAHVGRAATNAYDRTVVLVEQADGHYAAPLKDMESGSWVVTTTVLGGTDNSDLIYRTKERIWIAP
jgi:nitrogen fixation protein FixH